MLHRVDKDGCSKMAPFRKDYITTSDDAYIDMYHPPLLRERALMLNTDKPRAFVSDRQLIRDPTQSVDQTDSITVVGSRLWGPNIDPYDGVYNQLLKENDRIFFGDTFVDGSGVIVKEDGAVSQCGFSAVTVEKKPDDPTVDVSENPDGIIECGCSNKRNSVHVCSDHCKEHKNCTGICRAKKPDQKLVMAAPIQAVYGHLPGNIQTTPRAELMAIYVAVAFGRSPQRIISDHLNHVVALRNWMLLGDTSFLNPSTPNLDIWRRLHAAITARGGLTEGSDIGSNFTIIWQPSHTRASAFETTDMKHVRRGNAAADYFANLGRGVHPSVSDLVIRSQARYKAAKDWITWIEKAAAVQYDPEFGMCDHDKRDKSLIKLKGSDHRVRVPHEARILRRMPWASNSLGTVEYTNDIWTQERFTHCSGSNIPSEPAVPAVPSDSVVARVAEMRNATRVSGSVRVRAYLDKFDVVNPRNSGRSSKRLLPISKYNEYDEPLPTVNASGHLMMTAGLGSEQYFWCNICCAYTGDRVRKLAKECDRVPRIVDAVTNLRKDLHPFNGTVLSVPARRMLKADVGCKLSLLDPLVSIVAASTEVAVVHGCGDHDTLDVGVMLHPQHLPTEDS